MSRPCSRVLDQPLRPLGLDDEDWLVGLAIFLFFHLFGWPFWGLVTAGAGIGALKVMKRGQPPGIVLHRLWSLRVPLISGAPPPPPLRGQRYSPWA